MKKKKTIIVIISSVIAVILSLAIVLAIFISGLRQPLYIENDNLTFDTTIIELFLKKGIPDEIDLNVCDTPQDLYTYNEKINGYDAECVYDFVYGLYRVDIIIKDIEYDKAVSMCEEMMQKQEEHYSQYDGYSKTDINGNEPFAFEANCEVNFGAPVIVFDYKYEFNTLKIYAIYQK